MASMVNERLSSTLVVLCDHYLRYHVERVVGSFHGLRQEVSPDAMHHSLRDQSLTVRDPLFH